MATPPLSTAQVAQKLGKSQKTVQRMAAAGKIPGAMKMPGKRGAYIFDAEVFGAYLAGRGLGYTNAGARAAATS